MRGFKSYHLGGRYVEECLNCKNGIFIGVAKMPVDVLLFGVRTESCLKGHEFISYPVRINVWIIF